MWCVTEGMIGLVSSSEGQREGGAGRNSEAHSGMIAKSVFSTGGCCAVIPAKLVL